MLTIQTFNDAGLLRSYVTGRFEQAFILGFSTADAAAFRRLTARLAKLSGLSRDQVVSAIRSDLEAI